jgi:uncharacterized radical SAM superfamily Fe-S cluster-containing enzyme
MHPHCGAATFLYIKDNDYIPMTKLVDAEKFANTFWKIYNQSAEGHRNKARMEALRLLRYIGNPIIRNLIQDIMNEGTYRALGNLMHRVVMVGIMHFQDLSNMDLDRVQRCAISYALPDGTIRSFCTYNSIHRPVVEKKFAMSVDDWVKKTGKKVNEYA